MACIFLRKLKGDDVSWRLLFRRKGIKTFATTFPTEEEARQFARDYEEKYVLDHANFNFDYLTRLRENKFYRERGK